MRLMRRQFWNREATERSFRQLERLSKSVDFVLIGGWAVYLYTGAQMSQDIDIVIGYESLGYFRQFGLKDSEGIRMKTSVVDGTVIDLFIEEYSDRDLPFPASYLLNNYVTVNGFKIATKEQLLLLKLWGYFSPDEIKHRKDIIDVLSLLFYAGIDMKKVKELAKRYKIDRRKSLDALLEYLDRGRGLEEFILESGEDYSRLRKKWVSEIRRTFG